MIYEEPLLRTSLFTTNGRRNKRRKKYEQQTNKQWCDLTILTKVCNSMTMTTKEKRLANSDIEISQHVLVAFKFLTELVVFLSLAFRLAGESYWRSDIHLRCPCLLFWIISLKISQRLYCSLFVTFLKDLVKIDLAVLEILCAKQKQIKKVKIDIT